jgi:hypothetical protein
MVTSKVTTAHKKQGTASTKEGIHPMEQGLQG